MKYATNNGQDNLESPESYFNHHAAQSGHNNIEYYQKPIILQQIGSEASPEKF